MELLEKAPKLNAADAHKVLTAYYETDFKVFDHVIHRKTRPLASVALHDAEENSQNSALLNVIKRFSDSNIAEYFNMSLTDFLGLPREYTNWLFLIAQERVKRSIRNIDKTAKDLDEMKTKK